MAANPNQMTAGGTFYPATTGSQSTPLLSASGSLAPSTTSSSSSSSPSSSTHSHGSLHQQQPQQQLPFVHPDGSGPMHQQQQPLNQAAQLQGMWNNNQNFTAFPSQQLTTQQQPQQQQQQQQPLPMLHNQMSVPAAGRLSSHESNASMTGFPQSNPSSSTYTSTLSYMSSQQQPHPAQAQQRFHNNSPPVHTQAHQQQQQLLPHQQQQQQLQLQLQQQQQQQQQHQSQQANIQSTNMQPGNMQQQQQPNMQVTMQAGMQSSMQQPSLMYNQFANMQPQQNQPFKGQHTNPAAASYAQASPTTNFSPMRMNYQTLQQPQQQPAQHSLPQERQPPAGLSTSPHLQPQQHQQQQQLSQSQPPSSPHHPTAHQYMANFQSTGQLGNIHGLSGMTQPQQSQMLPQLAAPFFSNSYTSSVASSAPLSTTAANQPVGAPLLNYAQPVPVSMAPSSMPSAVVMASTATTPSTYAAVHNPRNKAARHHPLGPTTATAVVTESKGGAASDAESSPSESTTPAAGSPSAKPAASPPKSKFPRPAASSHPPFQLLKTESKRPYATLLYTANKRMLPSFLAKKQALFGQEQPAPPADSPDMVNIKVRVMALNILAPPTLPSINTLYFVAADISAIIHSRKSNIAKAVSSFPDDEKKRASVLCMQQNGTVSTHSLTVLSWKGVERLLNFSCAPVALPFLEWLRGEVYRISSPDSLTIHTGSSGKLSIKAEVVAEMSVKADMAHENGASPANSIASSSVAESSEDEKVDSPPSSLPDTSSLNPHLSAEQQQQQQAVA